MPTKNLQISEIVQLLYAGSTAEAKRLTALESERLEAQLTELKGIVSAVAADLTTIRSLMPPADSQMSSEEAGLDAAQGAEARRLTQTQKRRRKREILDAAAELSQNGGEFTSDAIAEILLGSGIVIGIPENRINTAIGGVLRRDEDYERVARGVYIRVKRDQPSQNGHGGLVQAEEASLG